MQQGKILYVGSSNFAGWHIAQAQEAAKARHFMGLVSEQSIYNLSNRMVELEVVPACRAYGLGLIPWSPLGGGLLAGVLRKAAEGRRAGEGLQKQIDQHRGQLEAYEALCAELGEAPADVGLAWLLQQSGRHRADRRAAHDHAARKQPAGGGDQAVGRSAQAAG